MVKTRADSIGRQPASLGSDPAIEGEEISGCVLIYGGSGGIGAATARALVAKGYSVHLVGRSEDKLATLATELNASVSIADVERDDTFDRVAAEAGPSLAGMVYAVGTITLKSLSRLSEAEFTSDFRINAVGAALALKASLPALKRHDGISSVVLFSSVAVQQGFSSHASVSMAKGAVEGLTRAAAAELAPKIRVNCIAPSLTRTPLAAALTESPQMAAAIAQLHPLGRLGEPKDVAGLAAFLVSDNADWITGQVMGADGGRSSLRTKG